MPPMVERPLLGMPVPVMGPVVKMSSFSGSKAPTPAATSSQNSLWQSILPPMNSGA